MTETKAKSRNILIAINLVGIIAITIFHPYIKYSRSPVTEWLYLSSLPVAGAALFYGIYALVFRKRARGSWPNGFLALAWLMAFFSIANPHMKSSSSVSTPAAAPISAHSQSQIDQFLSDAPAHLPGKWTQESTRSVAKGPWLQYSPSGARFCRAADGTIFTVYPPGVKPEASDADPACLTASVEKLEQL